MTRLRGRAPRGQRLVAGCPHGHWTTTTMISSVRLDGTSACMTCPGATDTEVFQAYVRKVLVPALRPGDIVVLDNLGAHKKRGHPGAHHGRRRRNPLPSGLLTRSQPDRDDVEQGEGVPTSRRGPFTRRPPPGHCPSPGRDHPRRSQELVCPLRLQFGLNSSSQRFSQRPGRELPVASDRFYRSLDQLPRQILARSLGHGFAHSRHGRRTSGSSTLPAPPPTTPAGYSTFGAIRQKRSKDFPLDNLKTFQKDPLRDFWGSQKSKEVVDPFFLFEHSIWLILKMKNISSCSQKLLFGVTLAFNLNSSVLGQGYSLTNGSGDGNLTVGVDGYGAFGSSESRFNSNAFYNPIGSTASAGTVFQSAIAIRLGNSGTRAFLSTGLGGLNNVTITGNSTQASSTFSHSGLNFSLTQTLVPLLNTSSVQIGTRLDQSYFITNPSALTISFELVRYLDGDLSFDNSIVDGGGRLTSSGEVLFETDSATGSADSATFVGITGSGGVSPTVGRYEINQFFGLRSRITGGSALGDTVFRDGVDLDQFVDAGLGYDITLALRNTFELPASGSATYSASTIFGSGTPVEVSNPTAQPIPEPSTWGAIGIIGVAGITGWLRRKKG